MFNRGWKAAPAEITSILNDAVLRLTKHRHCVDPAWNCQELSPVVLLIHHFDPDLLFVRGDRSRYPGPEGPALVRPQRGPWI